MQRIKLGKLQGYYLTLTLKEVFLTLEIEEESSGRVFSLDLDEESVYEATDNFFETLEDLFEGLKSAANGSKGDFNLILSKEELTYIGNYSLGADKMQHSFVLKLTEKRVEKVEVIEKQFKLLEQWKEKYDTEIQRYQESLQLLKAENEKMAQSLKALQDTQRFEKLEKLYDNLRVSIPLKSDIFFNNQTFETSKLKLSDNNKTATSRTEILTPEILFPQIVPGIPSSGEFSYSLRINQATSTIGFGIIELNLDGNNFFDFMFKNHRYIFWTNNGRISGRFNKQAIQNRPTSKKNSIIKMIVNMDQGILTFFVDNIRTNSCSISKSDKYFVVVYFNNFGDSVTLL